MGCFGSRVVGGRGCRWFSSEKGGCSYHRFVVLGLRRVCAGSYAGVVGNCGCRCCTCGTVGSRGWEVGGIMCLVVGNKIVLFSVGFMYEEPICICAVGGFVVGFVLNYIFVTMLVMCGQDYSVIWVRGGKFAGVVGGWRCGRGEVV